MLLARGEVVSKEERASKSSDRERSGAASSPKQKSTKRKRDCRRSSLNIWICSSCEGENKLTEMSCRYCNNASPAVDHWVCNLCNTHNEKLAEKCMGCEEANPFRVACRMCTECDVYAPNGSLCVECVTNGGSDKYGGPSSIYKQKRVSCEIDDTALRHPASSLRTEDGPKESEGESSKCRRIDCSVHVAVLGDLCGECFHKFFVCREEKCGEIVEVMRGRYCTRCTLPRVEGVKCDFGKCEKMNDIDDNVVCHFCGNCFQAEKCGRCRYGNLEDESKECSKCGLVCARRGTTSNDDGGFVGVRHGNVNMDTEDTEAGEEFVVIEAPIENSWTCGKCTYRNKMSDKSCRACDGPSPAIDKWVCEKCTVHNDKLAEKCMGCDEVNPFRVACSMCTKCDVYAPDGPLCVECVAKGGSDKYGGSTMKDPAGRHKTRDDQKRDGVIEAPIENSWTCGSCTWSNKMSYKRCRACDGPSPAIDKWVCEKCTVHNDKLAEQCMGCEEANPHRAKCSKCQFRDVYTPDGPLCGCCTDKVGRSSKCGECGELIPECGHNFHKCGAPTVNRCGISNFIDKVASSTVVKILVGNKCRANHCQRDVDEVEALCVDCCWRYYLCRGPNCGKVEPLEFRYCRHCDHPQTEGRRCGYKRCGRVNDVSYYEWCHYCHVRFDAAKCAECGEVMRGKYCGVCHRPQNPGVRCGYKKCGRVNDVTDATSCHFCYVRYDNV